MRILTAGQRKELKFQMAFIPNMYRWKIKIGKYLEKYLQLSVMVNLMGIKSDSKVLDVGCGIASVLHFIDCNKTGLDSLAEEYKRLYNYPTDMKIKDGSGDNMPFKGKMFDSIFCTNALDHMENPQATIKEAYRVLKPGGYFLVSCEIFPEGKERDEAHPHSFTVADITSIMEQGGFNMAASHHGDWVGIKNSLRGRPPVGVVWVSLWRKPKC